MFFFYIKNRKLKIIINEIKERKEVDITIK